MVVSPPVKALAIFCVVFAFAWACRVLIPYYQQQQDEPVETESQSQVRAIMTAIDRFVEQDPEHRFPTNMAEVTPLIALATNNLETIYSRFVYLPPPPHASKKELFGRVVLIEKLGHYKHRVGGYEGKAGTATPGWYSIVEYRALAEKNGVSIEDLSEHPK
jgi:hypothetical protein